MRVKLRELYNTRYFYITYRCDLLYLFSTVVKLRQDPTVSYNVGNELLGKVYDAVKRGEAVEFDVADCRFTPDTIQVIQQYELEGITFCDSKETWRDDLFRTNRERISIDASSFVELPKYDPAKLIKDYIVELDKETTYKMPVNEVSLYVPIAIMILLSRPSIKLNIDTHCRALFNYVGYRLSVDDLDKYSEFYLTTLEGTQVVDFSNGTVHLQRIGDANVEQALTVGTLVPTVFGKEKLLSEDCWRGVFKSCLNQINGYRATRKQSISEVLGYS